MQIRVSIVYSAVCSVLLLAALASCKKLVEVEPKDELDEKNMYRNVFDADAAVIGVYGKFMGLAEQYIVLNELRGDLTTVTATADANLQQIDAHKVQDGNPYASPKPFYEVILNCNDVLHNLGIMLADKKLKVEEYNMRYSDIATLRCWLYLQLGIHFGKVPYVTDDIADVSALDAIRNLPRFEFNQLLDTLTRQMESLPYMQPYASSASLVTTVDGYVTNKFFINKQIMEGQLYLWKGDYRKAAIAFKTVMEVGGTGDLNTNRITYGSKADNNDIAVGYIRFREWDENMLVDNNSQGWRSIFARSEDKLFNYEWIWYLPFNKSFKPVDPFINLFSNKGGSYLLKPSQYAIDKWNSQVQKNDFTYDARGKVFSWRMLNNQPVIMKYLYNYLDEKSFAPVNVFEKNGKWFLYRAASLHLDFAEAANRDAHQSLAYALVNQGLPTVANMIPTEGTPYNFDARKSDNPKIVGDWCANAGIRGRANLYSPAVTGDSTLFIEDQVIGEAGLELAYEGRRWPDLLRIALRRNDPAFLADKIYNKLVAEHNPAAADVRARLMNKENWYLPFRW
ncbi:RagB/SusD family protein [Niastella yeongjuensis]|uniref:RagB/SusD family protein n=1 Tax=Niastella yeongjuensis TaxID=354355 RepID=A0A1V9F3A2_9BACT|nr:RagB/SusD family nutrient uptake outer membrane protein [Niastella yeongjuensis]OQP52859.1 RagB/SusD family protein [Niastella yeongjuensis]SEP21231.1 SusD family protein [Niastella yeongjuensis]